MATSMMIITKDASSMANIFVRLQPILSGSIKGICRYCSKKKEKNKAPAKGSFNKKQGEGKEF
jgi:hypothetical protein